MTEQAPLIHNETVSKLSIVIDPKDIPIVLDTKMAYIDEQYIIRQKMRVQHVEKYQNAKVERQIMKARKQHERNLRKTNDDLGIAMAAFDAFIEPVDDKGEIELDELEKTIIQIRNKANKMIVAAHKYCAMRCWICADDGYAHPFEYRGCNYYRTYSGEMWKDQIVHEGNEEKLGDWAGVWNGKYIGKGEEPQQKPDIIKILTDTTTAYSVA